MTKQELLEHCLHTYGTTPDHPFSDDFETAVLRNADNSRVIVQVIFGDVSRANPR